MRYTFRGPKNQEDVEASTIINRPKEDTQDGRSEPDEEYAGVVMLLGADEVAKLDFIDNLQRYHDVTQFSKRYRLYKDEILFRTYREFRDVLEALKIHATSPELNEIKKEMQPVLEHHVFSESTAIQTSLLTAMQTLCGHNVVKQRLHLLRSQFPHRYIH